jgi:enediyne biosynthesis protein E5
MTAFVESGPAESGAAVSRKGSAGLAVRLAASVILIGGYFAFRESVVVWIQRGYTAAAAIRPATLGVGVVVALLAALMLIWWRILAIDKRFHAPLLVTAVLLIGDAGFSVLENHSDATLAWLTGGVVTGYSPTLVTIAAAVAAELVLGRFFYGRWPHLASAYVSGISAGILIKSPLLWPFVMCALISITSKYALRVGDRHLWNPTNFGVTVMLALAHSQVATLTVQAGNEIWAALVIWLLGGMILYQLGRLHVPLAFLATFLPLVLVRVWWTGNPWLAELSPITSPMFQLFLFFMITDPKTTTRTTRSRCVVAALVAVMETVFRLVVRDDHSLYHALFTVGPAANLFEIVYLRLRRVRPESAGRTTLAGA